MANVWILMHNKEVTYVHDGEDGVATVSSPIRVYQQHATAEAMMNKANLQVREQEVVDNFVYYSIEEVAYV